jgi:hypothetical protein
MKAPPQTPLTLAVLAVIAHDSVDDAVRVANHSDFRLQANITWLGPRTESRSPNDQDPVRSASTVPWTNFALQGVGSTRADCAANAVSGPWTTTSSIKQ